MSSETPVQAIIREEWIEALRRHEVCQHGLLPAMKDLPELCIEETIETVQEEWPELAYDSIKTEIISLHEKMMEYASSQIDFGSSPSSSHAARDEEMLGTQETGSNLQEGSDRLMTVTDEIYTDSEQMRQGLIDAVEDCEAEEDKFRSALADIVVQKFLATHELAVSEQDVRKLDLQIKKLAARLAECQKAMTESARSVKSLEEQERNATEALVSARAKSQERNAELERFKAERRNHLRGLLHAFSQKAVMKYDV